MVEFGLASREMLLGLFRYVYLPLSSKTERVGDKNEGVVNNQDAQDTQKHIQELAAMFADRVPAMKYSPAQILSFLIAHRHSPRDAVENVISWVEKGGEGFIPLRRHTSTMNTKSEEAVDVFVSMDDLQSWSAF
ncbi:mitochondrial chaperone bcs1 [Beauveria bassiana ARSEF 2860]|uniref:Mitochondrial chaperone bcs1 n=1 Tax=Beauveria bassiana (strain ARSEF 2860) TaxID=655819 RepID=J4KKN5_BEAB2|nr:mitochondrial chaperone bcs1 [Beauveria bassiana ARSEF 2860]EJP60764.1 mitochondrial chaperone bcs1 [Beauveria bassiana ARSEF 2860]